MIRELQLADLDEVTMLLEKGVVDGVPPAVIMAQMRVLHAQQRARFEQRLAEREQAVDE